MESFLLLTLLTGTVITSDMVKVKGELEKDVRKVEYNTISLGSQLESGKYVDIRLRLPSGGDYIVVSHKKIEIPTIEGVASLNTLWLELSETEILSLNCALVESYKIEVLCYMQLNILNQDCKKQQQKHTYQIQKQ